MKDVLRVVSFLGLVGLCCGSSAVWISIMSRFCMAEYAFKFRVVSSPKGECAPDLTDLTVSTPPPDSGTSNGTSNETAPVSSEFPNQVTTKAIPTPRSTERATETATGIANNSLWDVLTDPTVQQASTLPDRENNPVTTHPGVTTDGVTERTNATANHTQLRRMKRCLLVYHQEVRILQKHIFKGGDKLKMLKGVAEKATRNVINMRLGIYMHKLKENHHYYFAGRSIAGELEANFFTVESWKEVKHLKKKFMATDTCQSS